MIIKIGDKEYSFDGYVHPINSVQKLAEDIYQQGRADQKEEDNEFFNFEDAWELEKKKVRADAIEEYKVKCQQKFKDLRLKTGRAWFEFGAGIDRCFEILDKVEEQLKEQNK